MSNLFLKFQNFASQYQAHVELGPPPERAVINDLGKEILQELKSILELDEERNFSTFSSGKGNVSKIPWWLISNSQITKSAQSGIYIVYLLDYRNKKLFLSLNQGYTKFKEKFKPKPKDLIQKAAKYIRDLYSLEFNDIYISQCH